MNADSERIIELFSQAMARSPDERTCFLVEACADEPEVRAQVESLLRAEEPARGFLKQPAHATAGTGILVTEKPGDRIGRYKLLQVIGEGGCGVVYMAEQEEPVRRRVALKVIKLGMDTKQVIARFEAERQVLALMDHPNIAKVIDGGATDTGRPYFVMELVRGLRITDYCNQNHLSTPDRLKLFVQVCQAIQHAHQKGIIHRDIKPSNILVTVNDGVAIAKVIDFGIARAIDQRLTDKSYFTAFQSFIGTPAYTSPEQAEMSSLDIDTRSDIYSLGVLLYELLTAQTPFDTHQLLRSGLDEMRRIIREEEPAKPSTRLIQELVAASRQRTADLGGENGGALPRHRYGQVQELIPLLRGELDSIVMKCLEKDRARRYETATGLAADIQRHLNHEPVLALPASTAYRFRKLVRRNKLVCAATTTVAGVLVLGAAVSTWQAFEARSARDAEKAQRLTAQRQLYVANMNLVQSAWEQNNISRARQLLAETATAPERGFEWYYWQRQTHQELSTLSGHGESILALAYSPDGQRIVTGSADRSAKVWDAASGEELLALQGHRGPVWAVVFSPDGQRILTGSGDRTATVWDAIHGKEILTLRGHAAAILSVAFSPDGQGIVTGSKDRTAEVWDATSGQELLALKRHTGAIFSVAFSPDGERIVSGSWDQTVRVWVTADGKELLTLKHGAPIFSAAFSPNGELIVGGSFDQTARVWAAADGHQLFTLVGHTAPIFSVAFSPDGDRIATGSDDQTAKLWNSSTGQELFTFKRHGSPISSLAFSPDDKRLITGGGSVGFSPDGQVINPGIGDRMAKVWELSDQEESLTLQGHDAPVSSVAFSPNGQRIVTGSFDKTARVWDSTNGKELAVLKGHTDAIRSLAFSPDGRRIVTASYDNKAKVWDVATRQELFPLVGHSNLIMSVAFSPDGQRIVTGSQDHTARVWDAASGKELLTVEGHADWVWSVAFSPDSQWIVTSSADQKNTARVWNAINGRELVTLRGHSDLIMSVAFSPDGQRIVTGSHDGTAKVWNAASGRELLTLKGHRSWIMSVAFSPDGKRLVTGSQDHKAKVWDALSGKELLTLNGHSGWIFSVAFSHDGQRIVTGSGDRTAKVWKAASAEQVASWQQEERVPATMLP